METKMRSFMRVVFLGCLTVLVSFSSAAGAEAEINELLKSVPAENSTEEGRINAEFMKLGVEGVTELCDMLKRPGDGDDRQVRYALHGLAMYTSAEGREAERKVYSTGIIEGLKAVEDKEVKAFLISQLQFAGKDEAVDALAGYLADERLCSPSAQALVSIGSKRAAEALTKGLVKSEGLNQVAIIKSLGELGWKPASKAIGKLADSEDRDTRQTAWWAIANIGDKSAEKILSKAMKKAEGYEKAVATSNYLLFVERLAEAGKKRQCAKICRKLIKESEENNVQCAALSILVEATGEDAGDELLAAMEGENEYLQATAVQLGEKLGGAKMTVKWIKKMKNVSAEARVKIVEMLGRRGDETALAAVTEAMRDEDKGVRLAAVEATIQLGGRDSIETVLGFLKESKEDDEIKAATEALMRIEGEEVLGAASEALVELGSEGRVAVIEGLARRNARKYRDAVFAQTADSDGPVRLAAIKAMGELAEETDQGRLIELMLKVEDGSEQKAAQRAVVAAAEQVSEVEQRADEILEYFGNVEASKKVVLLRTLGRAGGKKATDAIIEQAKSDDTAIKDGAIRALADLPNEEALAGHLMNVIRKEELKYQALSVRKLVEVLNTVSIDGAKKVQICREALGILERADEKRLLLGVIGKVRSAESLEVAGKYLEDESLKSEAAIAAANIALPEGDYKGLGGYETAKVLKKALGGITDEKLRQRIEGYIKELPESLGVKKEVPGGFEALFNGKDLAGWRGVLLPPNDNPIKRAQLSSEEYTDQQAKADESMRSHWYVEDGVLVFDGKGFSLSTERDYEDFELYVDWKIEPKGDSGIYLRGSPQVQIWDPAVRPEGSGGLFNNKKGPSKPLVCADNPVGEWNTFYIKMVGERVTVYLNDKLIVDDVVLENYWDREQSIFGSGPIELQCHGHKIYFNNIFVREIPREGWVSLFNGKDFSGWVGDTDGYAVEDGVIASKQDSGGNIYTVDEFGDFHFKFEFKLTDGANNGLAIRAPLKGDAAYMGMEIQILDNTNEYWEGLKPYQYHGSIYGVIAAKREYLKPVGEWNSEEVIARGRKIKVILNGTTILDDDISEAIAKGAADKKDHPGLRNKSGHIGFCGHGDVVYFRNLSIKKLEPAEDAGFTSLFNGKDLTDWVGDTDGYTVEDGSIMCKEDSGGNIYADEEFSDFHLKFEFKLTEGANNGLAIRSPSPGHAAYEGMEIQILDDTAEDWADLKPYQYHGSIYGVAAAKRGYLKPVGEWNKEEVIARGNKIKVILNGTTILDADISEAIANGTADGKEHPGLRNKSGHIGFCGHGDVVYFRNIRIEELIPVEEEGFRKLFNGMDLTGWVGDTAGYQVEGGEIICKPGGNLYTADEFGDFHFKFDFKLTEGANNGLGIRAPLEGDAAYVGMEIQILDNTADKWAGLKDYQYHGSIYGVVPAKRGYLKPAGEWNSEEVIARGKAIKVILNGETIVDADDADITEAIEKGTMDGKEHPGLRNESGHICFCGHGDVLYFRNIRIKEL
jgi:HEAT repeat protein